MTHTDEGCALLRHHVRPREGIADLALAFCDTCHELVTVPAASPATAHPDSLFGARSVSEFPRSLPAPRPEQGAGVATQPA